MSLTTLTREARPVVLHVGCRGQCVLLLPAVGLDLGRVRHDGILRVRAAMRLSAAYNLTALSEMYEPQVCL